MVDNWNAMASRGWVEPVEGTEIPEAAIDLDERERLRLEIEALVAHHVFGLTRDEFEIVIDSFVQLAETEEREHGEYRTKRLILEIYDELAEAIATGQPYQTRLDPPPADPRVAHPPRDGETTAEALSRASP